MTDTIVEIVLVSRSSRLRQTNLRLVALDSRGLLFSWLFSTILIADVWAGPDYEGNVPIHSSMGVSLLDDLANRALRAQRGVGGGPGDTHFAG